MEAIDWLFSSTLDVLLYLYITTSCLHQSAQLPVSDNLKEGPYSQGYRWQLLPPNFSHIEN